MKKAVLLLLLAIASGCDKDDNTTTQALPSATQSGKGTFACYVDGKPFIDKSGGWFNCFYQFVDGEYYFSIGGENDGFKNSNSPWGISLGTIGRTISTGDIIQLGENANNSGGAFFTFSINNSEYSTTNPDYLGELKITKMDFTNNIISGTFYFDIKHPITGKTVEIRDGRFDTLFTQ